MSDKKRVVIFINGYFCLNAMIDKESKYIEGVISTCSWTNSECEVFWWPKDKRKIHDNYPDDFERIKNVIEGELN